MVTLDNEKEKTIKEIFWEFHTIESEVKDESFFDETSEEEKTGNVGGDIGTGTDFLQG